MDTSYLDISTFSSWPELCLEYRPMSSPLHILSWIWRHPVFISATYRQLIPVCNILILGKKEFFNTYLISYEVLAQNIPARACCKLHCIMLGSFSVTSCCVCAVLCILASLDLIIACVDVRFTWVTVVWSTNKIKLIKFVCIGKVKSHQISLVTSEYGKSSYNN